MAVDDPREWLRQRRTGGRTAPARSTGDDPRDWLARRRGIQLEPGVDLLDPEDDGGPEYGWGDLAATTALRVVPSVGGGLAGMALGTAAGPAGSLAGLLAGGGAGGAIGETLAQTYEQRRGLRDGYNPLSIGVEAGLGALPMGKTATVGKAAAKGAAMGTAGVGLHSLAETGELPSPGQAAAGAAFGGAFGGGAHAALTRILRRGGPPQTAQDAPGATPADEGPRPAWFDELEAQRTADSDAARLTATARARGMLDQEGRLTRPEGTGFGDYVARDAAIQGDARSWLAQHRRQPSGARELDFGELPPSPPPPPARPTGLAQYFARDSDIQADAARDRVPVPPVDATVPDRLKAPPPPRAVQSWEGVDPNWTTPAEATLQNQIPSSLLPEGSSARRVRDNQELARVLRMNMGQGQTPPPSAPPAAPGAPPPATGATPIRPARRVESLAVGGRLLPIYEFDGRQIDLDPSTYQFKESDAKGVTGALRGVTEWDPNAASTGPITVHERLDGRLFVADGHQRLNKWQELAETGADLPPIRAVVMREADGYDVETVRRIASLQNVRQASADPIDIAKLLRTGPMTPQEAASMPRGSVAGPKLAQAEALTQLSDTAFQAVVNREVPSTWGAMVARRVSDPDEQLTILRTLANSTDTIGDDVEADALIRELLRTNFVQISMGDIFGTQDRAVSLAGTLAKIHARVVSSLNREARQFRGAVKGQETLEAAGNVMARDENQARVTEAKLLADEFVLRENDDNLTRKAMLDLAARIERGEATIERATTEIIPAIRADLEARRRGGPTGAVGTGGTAGAVASDAPTPPGTVRPGESGPGGGDASGVGSTGAGSGGVPDAPPAAGTPNAWDDLIRGNPNQQTVRIASMSGDDARAALNRLDELGVSNEGLRNALTSRMQRAYAEDSGQGSMFGGDRGFASPDTMIPGGVAGAAVGASVGAASGDEDATFGERATRAVAGGVLGGAAGAVGPSALARLLERRGPSTPSAAVRAAEQGASNEQIAATLKMVRRAQQGGSLETATGRARGKQPVVEFTQPTADVPPTERMPAAQRKQWIRLEKFPEPLRRPLAELVDEVEELALETQRRGKQTWKRTEALASHMRVAADKPLKPGTTLAAAGQEAYANALAAVVAETEALSRAYAKTPADEVGLRLMQLNAARSALVASVSGLRSEAGRALNIWRKLKSIQPAELRLAQEFINRGRIRKDMSDLAEQLGSLPADPTEALKVLGKLEQQDLASKAVSYYVSNILSGVQTQQRNFIGNLANMVSRIAIKGVTAPGVDALTAVLTGRPREVFTREALHETVGAAYAIEAGVRDAFETLRHGFSPRGIEEGLTGITQLYLPKREFAGGLMNPLNLPGRALEAGDRLFVTMNRSAELYGQSYAIARKEAEARRLSGKAFQDYIAKRTVDLRANPSKELQQSALLEAQHSTFREESGAFSNAVIQMRKHVPAVGFIVPFVRTVANIFRQGMEHTPAGFVMKRARSENLREASIAQGRAAFGSLLALPIAYMATTGRLSGAGPKDPTDRAALFDTGWRPNSIKLKIPDDVARTLGASKSPDGEYWVNYALFQPFSIPAAIVANAVESYAELAKEGTEKTVQQSAEELVAQTIARIANTAMSQTYLQGVFGLVGALENPERGAVNFARQLARGLVPMSGFQNSLAKTLDPTLREADTLGDELKRGIPGLSQSLRPRLDRFGRPIERSGSPIRRGMLVPEVEPTKDDAIAQELSRLDIRVSAPTARVDLTDPRTGKPSRQITREEAYALKEVRGKSTRAALARVILAPGYGRLPEHVKRERIEDALARSGRRTSRVTRTAFRQDRPDLMEMLRARAERQTAAYER